MARLKLSSREANDIFIVVFSLLLGFTLLLLITFLKVLKSEELGKYEVRQREAKTFIPGPLNHQPVTRMLTFQRGIGERAFLGILTAQFFLEKLLPGHTGTRATQQPRWPQAPRDLGAGPARPRCAWPLRWPAPASSAQARSGH